LRSLAAELLAWGGGAAAGRSASARAEDGRRRIDADAMPCPD
jgi:hypothetical protein